MVCVTAPLPMSCFRSKASPGQARPVQVGGRAYQLTAFAEAPGVKRQSKEGGPQPIQEVPSLLPHFKKGKLRLAFQLPRPRSMRPSPCLSLDTRILPPRFSSSSTITSCLHRPPAGLKTCAGLNGSAQDSLSSGHGCSPRAPGGRRGDSWPHGGGAGVERGWPPRRTAIGRGPLAGGGVRPRPLCHWPRRRWGRLPAQSAARRRTAGARLTKAARGCLSSSQLCRPPAGPDHRVRCPRRRQEADPRFGGWRGFR